MNYYNEIDKSAANWLKQLIKDGLIPPGDVDERSIVDVKPDELKSYVQCHFFCGIAGWPLALQLAQWPTDRPVWTGSCPCQPFSVAGKCDGIKDERHLWPVFFELIRECGPETVFGEQVASAEIVGSSAEAAFLVAVQQGDCARANKLAKQLSQSSAFHYHSKWLDGISADLESAGYACGATVLGAHSVGAPHIRQRLYWVADSLRPRLEGHSGDERDGNESGRINPLATGSAPKGGEVGGVAIPNKLNGDGTGPCSSDDGGQRKSGELRGIEAAPIRLGNTKSRGLGIIRDEAQPWSGGHADGAGELSGLGITDRNGRVEGFASAEATGHRDSAEPASFWSDSRWILCRDGKHRRIPTQPALFPLADGLSYKLARRGSIRPALLKGAGNAIVPQVAAEFVTAFMEIEQMNQQNTIQ